MNIKLIKFLAGLCAVLLLVILGEWLYLNHARKALLEEIKTVDKKPKPMAELPTLELTRRPESSYVNMVSRPLFIQGRRPVNEAPQATAAKPVASGTFNWTLNGIYTHKRRTYALLTRNGAKVPKDNFRKVSVSSDIDGWQVEEIQKDKIVVSQADQRKELPLHKIKPKTNNPAQPQNPGMATMPPPVIPGQVPPPGIPAEQMPDGMVPPVPPIPEPVPGGIVPEQIPPAEPIPEIPEMQDGMPVPEPIPESVMPETIPEPEPPLETEILPDQPSEIIENNENVLP